jgi:pimeloyl-ACP methyl ester carboxylesterase
VPRSCGAVPALSELLGSTGASGVSMEQWIHEAPRLLRSNVPKAAAGLIALVAFLIASPILADSEAEGQIPSTVYTHSAELFALDGHRRLNMYCVGAGTPAIVFIAGAWENMMTWRRVQGRASQSARACSYDRAGLGFSDPAQRDSTAENAVDDLKNLLDVANIKTPVVLVGHSAGGLYAMLFAASHRDRVAGIVLVDPSDSEANNNLALSGQPSKYAEEMRRQTEANHAMLRRCVDLADKGLLTPSNTDPYCLMNEADPILKKELDRQHVRLQTKQAILSEMISLNALVEGEYSLDGLQFRKAIGNGSFGKLPLILLRRANRQKHPALPQEVFEKNEAVFIAGYERMAAYSSIGIVRPISNSGHSIQLDQPQAVVTAIQEVVAAVRGGP